MHYLGVKTFILLYVIHLFNDIGASVEAVGTPIRLRHCRMIALVKRWLFIALEDGGSDLHADGCRVPGRNVL